MAQAVWRSTQDVSLLDQATRIGDATQWKLSGTAGYGRNYFWTSDHALIVCQYDPKVGMVAVHVDTEANVETPVPAARKSFVPSGDINVETARLSPDGRRLLWSALEGGHLVIYAAQLDGGGFRRWKCNPAVSTRMTVMWMPDSRHWVEFGSAGRGWLPVIHDLYGGEIQGQAIANPAFNPYAIMSDRRVVSCPFPEPSGPVLSYPVEPGAGRLKTYPAFQPILLWRYYELAIACSPRCDRVAFLCYAVGPTTWQTTLARLIPSLHLSTPPESILWAAHLDGSNVRLIGKVSRKHLVGLQWTLDGKRLSFLCDNALYTVPAD